MANEVKNAKHFCPGCGNTLFDQGLSTLYCGACGSFFGREQLTGAKNAPDGWRHVFCGRANCQNLVPEGTEICPECGFDRHKYIYSVETNISMTRADVLGTAQKLVNDAEANPDAWPFNQYNQLKSTMRYLDSEAANLEAIAPHSEWLRK